MMVQHVIVHRMIIIRRRRNRTHWRQYRHGPDHDVRVVYRWAERWLMRDGFTLVESPTIGVKRPGEYDFGNDFIRNYDGPIAFEMRGILGGQKRGLPVMFPVKSDVHTIVLDQTSS